jgi:4'-phosphopantetheinyl transferase
VAFAAVGKQGRSSLKGVTVECMLISHIACGAFPEVVWVDWPTDAGTDNLAVFRYQWDHEEPISPYLISLLQPEERVRSQRYYRQEDRQRYIYGRAILRIVAGAYIDQRPTHIRFGAGIHQKPVLLNDAGWCVNLTHAGQWIVLAIGQGEVGIDVERINPDFAFQDLLPASFSQPEQHFIDAGPDARSRFYQLWTRKEALIKATGKGIDTDFPQIPSLTGEHAVESALIGQAGSWRVNSFRVSPDYPAAIAYPPSLRLPVFYTLNRVLLDEAESKWSS